MHLTDRPPPTPLPTPRPVYAPENWEHAGELYPGASVLDDLQAFPADAQAARWIIVRYAAVRAIAQLLSREVDEYELRIGRSTGLNHVLALPMLDREAWSLKRALESLSEQPSRTMIEALLQAGAGAEQRTHVRGAFAIYQIAYHLARQQAWHAEAARAARGVERIVRAGGAVYAPRLWRRRARVMEKKCAVA